MLATRGRLTKKQESYMRLALNCFNSAEDTAYYLHAKWFESQRFAHGYQHEYYNLERGGMVSYSQRNQIQVVYNFVLPIIESQKTLLLSSKPQRKVHPMGEDDTVINAAEYASDLLEWADTYHDVERMAMDLSAYLVECGNAFVENTWDPDGGYVAEVEGEEIDTGNPVLRVRSPYDISFHPDAPSFEESPWCTSDTLESYEWGEEVFGRAKMDAVRAGGGSAGTDTYDRALLNPTLSTGAMSDRLPDDMRFWRKFELWHVPCRKYPSGLYLCFAGSTKPEVMLDSGPNKFVDLPFTHFKLLDIPGNAWGRSLIPDLMPPQKEINRRRGQLIKTANRITNAMMLVPKSVSQELITNRPVAQVPIADANFQIGAIPQYMMPPMLPDHVLEGERSAIEALNYIASPVGPGADAQSAKATSGIQLSLMEELRQRKVAPMLRRWEISWDQMYKKYLRTFERFQIVPRPIGVLRQDGSWKSFSFGAAMGADRVMVKIVPYSSMSVGHTATFAQIIELTKAGFVNPIEDPEAKNALLEAIKMGHLARPFRSWKGQNEKARRNLQEVRLGQYDDIWPDELVDNPEVHISVYTEWMETEEYKTWSKGDQEGEMILRTLVRQFMALQQNKLAQMQMQAIALSQPQGGGLPFQQASNGPAGVEAAGRTRGPGNPLGGNNPMATQGFGRAGNPMSGAGMPHPDATVGV